MAIFLIPVKFLSKKLFSSKISFFYSDILKFLLNIRKKVKMRAHLSKNPLSKEHKRRKKADKSLLIFLPFLNQLFFIIK